MSLDKDDLHRHLSGQFNDDLKVLMSDLRTMGQLVSSQLHDALQALAGDDAVLAMQVVARDSEVNRLELRLDEECRDVLVRRQPAAGDLRLVFAVIKAVMDLERMGDLAKRVAKATVGSSGAPQRNFAAAIVELGASVLMLANKATAAFADFDATAAAVVRQEDRAIDERCKAITAELEAFIKEDPESTGGALQLIWATRALERFGDHAKNVAEYVYYAVYGKEIRHMSEAERAEWLPRG